VDAPLTVMNNTGSTTLVVDSSIAFPTTARTVTHDTFQDAGGATYGRIAGLLASPVNYRLDRVPTVQLRSGAGDDRFNVLATGATALTIETGDGHDRVIVGNANRGLDDIRGTLTLDGGAGNNGLTLNDAANS